MRTKIETGTFKAVQVVTGTTHFVATGVAKAAELVEGFAGEKLKQGTSEEIKLNRMLATEESYAKINDTVADAKARAMALIAARKKAKEEKQEVK